MSRILSRCLLLLLAVVAPLAAGDQPRIHTLRTNDHVLFLGDSTTAGGLNAAGYVRQFEQAIGEQVPELKVMISGIGRPGAPTGLMIEKDWMGKDVKPLLASNNPPTVCVVNMGLNDALAGAKGVAPYGENLRRVVRQGREMGLTMLLCTPTMRDGLKTTEPYALKAREVAAAENCPLIDLYTAHADHLAAHTRDGKPAAGADTTYDGVHLTAAGETASAKAVLQAFGLRPEWRRFQVRNKSNPPFGTYMIEPAQPFYEPGTKLTITAVPAPGKVFTGWVGDMAPHGTTNPVTILIDRHLLISIPKREFGPPVGAVMQSGPNR
jgi:lysophospholipase L1-like esterase